MTPPRAERLKLRVGIAVGALAVVLAGLVAIQATNEPSKGPSPAAKVGLASVDPTPPTATPTRYTGPQGRVGQFVVRCPYTHSGPHDPIVHFGQAGRSHRHDFYGSAATNSTATIADLQAAPTTCDKSVDTAAYWQPTLYDHDRVVVPIEAHAYYRAAPGVPKESVRTMPAGLALIAGDHTATTPQPGEATGWTCGTNTVLSDEPPTCTADAPLHLVLTFQDCWDGVHLDSEDHTSHAAYSTDGRCPPSRPVPIPQLTVAVDFPIWGSGHDLRLASGNIFSAHGDFWNAWDPAGLEREITSCIHRGAVCDLASNRAEEALFSGGS